MHAIYDHSIFSITISQECNIFDLVNKKYHTSYKLVSVSVFTGIKYWCVYIYIFFIYFEIRHIWGELVNMAK